MEQQESNEGIDSHVDEFLAKVHALEGELYDGKMQPPDTLDLSGRNPNSPWYIYNELKLSEAADTVADIMKDLLKEDGVTDEARLKVFHGNAKEYLGRRTFMRKHLSELYLKAKGRDTEYVKKVLSQIYNILKQDFVKEFKVAFAKGEQVQPEARQNANAQPQAQPKQAQKTQRRGGGGGGMELDAATRARLGVAQTNNDDLYGKRLAYGERDRTGEVDRKLRK